VIRPLHIDDLKQLVTLRDEVPSETSGDSNPRETENRAIMEQLLPALFVGYPRDIDGIHNLVDETSAGKLTAMLAVTQALNCLSTRPNVVS